jgi:hypothetical protein
MSVRHKVTAVASGLVMVATTGLALLPLSSSTSAVARVGKVARVGVARVGVTQVGKVARVG